MFGTPIIIMGMHVMLLTRTRLQHAGVSNLRCLVCLCQRLVPPGIQPFLNYRLCRPARTKTKEKQINDDFLDQMPNEINMRNVNIFLNKYKYLSVCPSVRFSLCLSIWLHKIPKILLHIVSNIPPVTTMLRDEHRAVNNCICRGCAGRNLVATRKTHIYDRKTINYIFSITSNN